MIKIVSFGYGHGPAPEAEITLDVRRSLRNPHKDPAMRYRTALDKEVRAHVMATPGAVRLVTATADLAVGLLEAQEDVTVAIGCVGGRHRSAALAATLQTFLAMVREDVETTLEHRDLDKPVLPSSKHKDV